MRLRAPGHPGKARAIWQELWPASCGIMYRGQQGERTPHPEMHPRRPGYISPNFDSNALKIPCSNSLNVLY
jgi:hypothetical protein